jgi:hypothetical protein
MAASKSASAFTWASGSSTASGTTNPIDCSTDYAQQVYVSVAVVGSPYWVIDVPVTATKVEIVYTAQTGGTSSTLVAQLGQVTGI